MQRIFQLIMIWVVWNAVVSLYSITGSRLFIHTLRSLKGKESAVTSFELHAFQMTLPLQTNSARHRSLRKEHFTLFLRLHALFLNGYSYKTSMNFQFSLKILLTRFEHLDNLDCNSSIKYHESDHSKTFSTETPNSSQI